MFMLMPFPGASLCQRGYARPLTSSPPQEPHGAMLGWPISTAPQVSSIPVWPWRVKITRLNSMHAVTSEAQTIGPCETRSLRPAGAAWVDHVPTRSGRSPCVPARCVCSCAAPIPQLSCSLHAVFNWLPPLCRRHPGTCSPNEAYRDVSYACPVPFQRIPSPVRLLLTTQVQPPAASRIPVTASRRRALRIRLRALRPSTSAKFSMFECRILCSFRDGRCRN
ncbi:hypothetical protein BV25DRAFT_152901 [Artomyces pyxidatus]|uniref:Uncharacterized protein n=1 Tax=Artomyces pyxidatus TaxID=48021 RepID=A0ACB8T9P2_9AGAM|nr:hypothetical protein BV25DRAFT_152901 [Artomyces pyxidatus]